MPPAQCPACGRFLKRALIDGLAAVPAPCPKCGIELTAASFADAGVAGSAGQAPPPPVPSPVEVPAPPSFQAPRPDTPPSAAAAASVRPPDLPPAEVRDEPDPLAGWDAGLPPGAATVRDERPFPLDTVVIVGAAALGGALGLSFGRRPLRDGALGAVGGALGAGLVRRIWLLP